MLNPPNSFAEWQDYRLYHLANILNVAEIPKLGSGKTDFSATKKIALINDQA